MFWMVSDGFEKELPPIVGWAPGGGFELFRSETDDRIAAHAHIFFANEQREPSQ